MVDVCDGGLRDANDLAGHVHYVLQNFPSGGIAVPCSDAASEDVEEVEASFGLLSQQCSLFEPGEIFRLQ